VTECPVCQGKIIERCKCMRGDSTCENGHEFHKCYVHKAIVMGHSDHRLPMDVCTCNTNTIKEVPVEVKTYLKNFEQWWAQWLRFKDFAAYRNVVFAAGQFRSAAIIHNFDLADYNDRLEGLNSITLDFFDRPKEER
jgi:hypothetical protein